MTTSSLHHTVQTIDFKHLCELSQLELNAKQLEQLPQHFTKMIGLIEQLQSIDVSHLTPLSHPHQEQLRRRDDVVTAKAFSVEELLQNAPQTDEGLFQVPQVIAD